jgi:hypothetical protein
MQCACEKWRNEYRVLVGRPKLKIPPGWITLKSILKDVEYRIGLLLSGPRYGSVGEAVMNWAINLQYP